jgi:hypothetical protein
MRPCGAKCELPHADALACSNHPRWLSGLPTNYFKTSSVPIGVRRRVNPGQTRIPIALRGRQRPRRARLPMGVLSENRFHLQAEIRQETS